MKIISKVIPLPIDNIDTDQIIPAQFLKAVKKEGFGEKLFYRWRYLPDGSENPDFILNDPRYKGAKILVAGENFGCGSSREHAVWALKQYGIDVVISSFFADIFKNNAYNNALLLVEVDKEFVEKLIESAQKDPETEVVVDVESQTVEAPSLGLKRSFEIPPFAKECFIKGVDTVGYLLSLKDKIEDFEKKHRCFW